MRAVLILAALFEARIKHVVLLWGNQIKKDVKIPNSEGAANNGRLFCGDGLWNCATWAHSDSTMTVRGKMAVNPIPSGLWGCFGV